LITLLLRVAGVVEGRALVEVLEDLEQILGFLHRLE
jgi:hypothetical protein